MEHNSTSDNNSGKSDVLVFTLYIYIYILYITCVFDNPVIHFLNRGPAESVRRGRHK